VTVDGSPAHLGQKIDPAVAVVEVDGVRLPVNPEHVYILLNKEQGVISTAIDTHGRTTVVDVVGAPTRVYPVGRLDADSEGLLVLTNDGALTERLTHPRYGVTKTYSALIAGTPGPDVFRRLVEGIALEDGPAAARSARLVDAQPDQAIVEIVMAEGRNREVRRMFDAVGHPVRRLARTAIGPLRDRELKPGEWRDLTVEEVRILYGAGDTHA
jgi:23S rRNA pseudouridine2605 synthase